MFEPGVIISEPETATVNGLKIRRALARLEPFGREVSAIMLPRSAGSRDAFPPVGTRVLLGVEGGATGYILGVFGTAPTLGDAYIAPTGAGEVYLGPGEVFQPVLLATKASAELVNLQAQINVIRTSLGTVMNAVTPLSGTAFQTALDLVKNLLVGGVSGGDPALKVQAAKGA